MGLFEGINFYIAEKSVKDASELKNVLVSGGGQREFYPSELVSHVITDTLPPPNLGLSRCTTSIMLHSEWVYMSSRCGVILPTVPFTLNEDKLLTGLVFCTSKLPHSDVEKIACLVFYYGGSLQSRLDATVTHLITMDTTGAKYECAVRHGIKVVTPDWLIDSINMGALVAEGDYQPMRRGHKLPQKTAQCNGDLHGNHEQTTPDQATSDHPVTKPEDLAIPPAPHTTNTDKEEGIVNTSDIDISTKDTIQSSTGDRGIGDDGDDGDGGTVSEMKSIPTDNVGVNSAAITSDGGSHDVREKEVIESGEGMEGEGSVRVEKLLTGLVFHLTGYLECMEEDTLSKWKEVIVQHGGAVIDNYDPIHCTHLLALHKKSDAFAKAYSDGKCISSAHWLNDVLTEGRMFPPRCALHFPTAFKWQIPGADKYSITLTKYSGTERELVKDMIHLTGISYTGHLSIDTTYLICKSASGKKYEKALEWGVTIVNASFLADIIHNGQVPAVLFPRHTHLGSPHEFLPSHCFEASRLLRPWEGFLQSYSKQNETCLDKDITEKVFRSVRRREREKDEDNEMIAKRQKIYEKKEVGPPVILLTGISQSIAKKLRETIQNLGGMVSDRPRGCTHLVAPRVARTVKFLSGVSVCHYVVTPEWVEQCEREGRLINEEGFTLRDTDAEEVFSMDIPTTLSRARAVKLLQGYCVYATANVQPSKENLKEIIECAGGKLITSSEAQSQFGRKFEKLGSSGIKLLVLSTPEDLNSGLCTLFTSHHIPIYNAELILTGALRQQLDLTQNILSSVSGPSMSPCSTTLGLTSHNEE